MEDDGQANIVTIEEAKKLSEERALDLVEVATSMLLVHHQDRVEALGVEIEHLHLAIREPGEHRVERLVLLRTTIGRVWFPLTGKFLVSVASDAFWWAFDALRGYRSPPERTSGVRQAFEDSTRGSQAGRVFS